MAEGLAQQMTEGLFARREDATPIDADDARGLVPTWVATQDDLNRAEQENIAQAVLWASGNTRMRTLTTLLTEESMTSLHRHMFRDVWKWAGTYRRHDTNIGAPWPYVPTQVRELLADAVVQTADVEGLPWSPDELAIRFHHRLVAIHPFPNGNGRHARLAADLLVAALGGAPFSWGSANLNDPGAARTCYLGSLRVADESFDYSALVEFARS